MARKKPQADATTFNVKVDGKYDAAVVFNGLSGAVSGTIASQWGTGDLEGAWVGNSFSGAAMLDGHSFTVTCALVGSVLSGELVYGWFIRKSFEGVKA